MISILETSRSKRDDILMVPTRLAFDLPYRFPNTLSKRRDLFMFSLFNLFSCFIRILCWELAELS